MAYGDGYKDLPNINGVEYTLMQMLVVSPLVDLLDSSKLLPRVILAVCATSLVTQEGRFVGLGLLQKLMAFGPACRANVLAALWLLKGTWWWFGRYNRSSPMWWVFASFVGYALVGYLVPSNQLSPVVQVPSVLSAAECARIITIAEGHGSTNGWTTQRHGKFSTEDIPVPDLPVLNETLQMVLVERLAPITRQLFGGVLEPVDAFVVRYSQGRQTSLRQHTDAGQVTYSVVLSDLSEYEGGGVKFPLMPLEEEPVMAGIEIDENFRGRIIRAPRGQALLHGAKVSHEGMELISGARYLLISFNHVRYDSWWQMLMNFHGALAKENTLLRTPSSELGSYPWPQLSK